MSQNIIKITKVAKMLPQHLNYHYLLGFLPEKNK
jgi:hypothetical protein